jgi:hypothetical protein
MKVKDVLRDLGPTTLVQIYKPSASGYEACFLRAYSANEIQNLKGCSWIDRNLDKDVNHVEYSHYYTTEEMISSCNIYLDKKIYIKVDNDVHEEKTDTTAIDYADLEKKWDIFRKQAKIGEDFRVTAWLVSLFLHMLSNGELVEMEDKDLS